MIDLLHPGAADDEHLVFSAGLPHRLDHAEGDVVVLGPDRVDLGEACQEVLHHFEAVVPVPVGIRPIEHLDLGSVDHFHKGVEPLVVDDRRDASQDDDLPSPSEPLGDVLSGDPSHGGIVPAT